jgi:hypothetical protein
VFNIGVGVQWDIVFDFVKFPIHEHCLAYESCPSIKEFYVL